MKLILATENQHKVAELEKLLMGTSWEVLSLKDFPGLCLPPETGTTFLENAAIKSEYVFAATGLPTLADDSGLEVAALGGEPGVHSARYAKDHDDQANNALLLKKLNGKTQRDARFVCALCLYFPNDFYFMAEGYCTGVITTEARGTNGFGYDPYFLVPEFDQTMAQMPLSVKNKISHRAKALQTLKEKLNENSCN